jgi:hypothetical protein
MKLLESPQALLPHAAGWGEAVTARLRRDRVIMNGPRLILVVSDICDKGYGAGRARECAGARRLRWPSRGALVRGIKKARSLSEPGLLRFRHGRTACA